MQNQLDKQNVSNEAVRVLDRVYVDGEWIPAGGEARDTFSAVTGLRTASVHDTEPAGIDRAVRAAAGALPGWAGLPCAERGRLLDRVADGLAARSAELAHIVSVETGMPLKLASRIQVDAPIAAWRSFAVHATVAKQEDRIGHSLVVRDPVGVVAAVTPWNYPLHQVTAKVAAALAAGATVVLKPSEVAPLTAFALAEAVHEAGVPAGVFNLVTGVGAVAGEALVSHPLVAMVSFTGSTAAGARVAAVAAGGLKRLALELGGKSAAILLEGADFPRAIRATLSSCLLNSGQTCNATTRLIVPEARFDEVAAIIRELLPDFRIGDPFDPATRLGPLATRAQRDKVNACLQRARLDGVPLIAAATLPEGLPDGNFVAPHVFGPVAADNPLVQEEIFGPVLVVQTHAGADDAIRLANGTRYGLAAAVWGPDEFAAGVARRLRAGQVDVNGAPFNPEAPFGGYGHSGLGRENGSYGIQAFQELKSIQQR